MQSEMVQILRFYKNIICQMQLENIERDLRRAQQNNFRSPLHGQNQHVQTKYRWIVLTLASMMMLLNGLLNNIIIPLETMLSNVYQVPSKVVNISTILSFLTFLLVNLPANYILDKRGIKFGFLVGNSCYLVGIILACCINVGYPFLVLGYLVFTLGQPFILNIPAQLATYWFFPENRALATSIMVGCNIIGSGLGYAIPTIVVKEDSSGEFARRQIFSLYLGYAIATFIMLIINSLLMKSRPTVSPTKIDTKVQLTIKQTFKSLKEDRNLWKFFGAYSLFYGTFLIFGASANFLIKPFGFSDVIISLAAVGLILFGAVGAVLGSIFIKRTGRYKVLMTITTGAATIMLAVMMLQLLIIPVAGITMIIVAAIGFFVVPVVPISYQLGCQMAFPIGQAQVTGLLNGGALFWAFIIDSILTAAIGFGTITRTVVFMFILILFLAVGAFLYFKTAILLKRKQFEDSSSPAVSRTNTESNSEQSKEGKDVEMITQFQENASTASGPSSIPASVPLYATLNQQRDA